MHRSTAAALEAHLGLVDAGHSLQRPAREVDGRGDPALDVSVTGISIVES
jgi:hypothetical protein